MEDRCVRGIRVVRYRLLTLADVELDAMLPAVGGTVSGDLEDKRGAFRKLVGIIY
jgi:hypothetical protein